MTAFPPSPPKNYVTLYHNKEHRMNRIKELLEAKGVSQIELACRLGKCFNTVNLYAANRCSRQSPYCIDSRHPRRECENCLVPNRPATDA